MKYSKYIVTGTAGFIGGFLSKNLKKTGAQVIDVDVVPRGQTNFKHLYPDELAHMISSSPLDFYNSILLHVGADSNANAKSLKELQTNNIDLTEQIVTRCNQIGIPVLFISSAAIYGNSKNGKIPFEKLSPYAESKFIGEQIVTRSGQDYGVGNLIFRLFNCYGEDEVNKGAMMSIPSRFVNDAINQKKIEIWDVCRSSKVQARDFIYVGDLAKLISNTISEMPFENQVRDAGSGTTLNFMEIAEVISNSLECQISKVPVPEHVNLDNYQLETKSNMDWLVDIKAKVDFSSFEKNIMSLIQRMT